MNNNLYNVLKAQLDTKVNLAALRINSAYKDKIAKTNFASKYSSLDKQGDLSPLKRGKNYKGKGLSIPDAIEEEFNFFGDSNIIKTQNNITIKFGDKRFLVSLSPQILWYEYGYTRGKASLGDEALNYIPPWFKINRRQIKSSRWFWVSSSRMGRFGEGALFPLNHGIIKAAIKNGKQVVESTKPIPEVAMFRRTLISIIPLLPKLIRGL